MVYRLCYLLYYWCNNDNSQTVYVKGVAAMPNDPIIVVAMEHFDENESTGNAATKYIVTFSNPVNCDWLWANLDEALKRSYNV
jgi:hypothetical protein